MPEPASFDAAVIMSQSFGLFESAANLALLITIGRGLRANGRIVLDLWNPEFFAAHQDEREFQTSCGPVRESKRMVDDRLLVELTYSNGVHERFEWQTFMPVAMGSFAAEAGFDLVNACTDFELSTPPSSSKPRIQFLLQRQA